MKKGCTFVPNGNQSIAASGTRQKREQQVESAKKQGRKGKPPRTRAEQIKEARDKNPYFDQGGGNFW